MQRRIRRNPGDAVERQNTAPSEERQSIITAIERSLLANLPTPDIVGLIMSPKPAIFFDRDGTLIEHVHYLTDPRQVRLMPDAAASINQLKAMRFSCVVVTNQSVIEKQLLDEAGLAAIHDEMRRQLADQSATLDAIYHCPRASIGSDPTQIEFEDRKPGPGMLQRAAIDLDLDMARSWMIGDSISDVLAGHNAGCQGSLWIGDDAGKFEAALVGVQWTAVKNLRQAVDHIAKFARI